MDRFKECMEAAKRAHDKVPKGHFSLVNIVEPKWLKEMLGHLGIPKCDVLHLSKNDEAPMEPKEEEIYGILEAYAIASKEVSGRTESGLYWLMTCDKDRKVELVLSNWDEILNEVKALTRDKPGFHRGISIEWLRGVMEQRLMLRKTGIKFMTTNKGGGFSVETLKKACAELGIEYCD